MAALRNIIARLARGQVARSGVASFAVRILSVLAKLASSIILARVLGPSTYGAYAYVLALMVLLTAPVQLGFPTLIVRETTRARVNRDWDLMRGLWEWVASGVLAISAIVIIGVLAWLHLGPEIEASRRSALIVALPTIPILALTAIRGGALRGLKYVFMSVFPHQILAPLLLVSFVLIASKTGYDVSAVNAMYMYVCATSISLAVGTLVLWKATPVEMRYAGRRRDTTPWLRSLVPLSMIMGFTVVSNNTGIVMLGSISNDEDVAIFRVASSLSALAAFGLSVVNLFIQPYFAEAHTKGDTNSLQRLAYWASWASLAFTIPVVVFIGLMGSWLIATLYGAGYSEVLKPLLILLVGQAVSSFFGSVANLLSMSGKEAYSMRILLLSTTINVVLNFALIPSFGTTGAAIATTCSTVLVNALMWGVAIKSIGIDSSPFGMIRLRKKR